MRKLFDFISSDLCRILIFGLLSIYFFCISVFACDISSILSYDEYFYIGCVIFFGVFLFKFFDEIFSFMKKRKK